MSRPRLLDLFCGAGLAADGYVAAGWDVVGMDIKPQPDYPYPFVLADALWFLNRYGVSSEYAAVHASPPCQLFTRAARLRDAQGGKSKYPDLLSGTIAAFRGLSIPWVIENVEGAKALMPGAVRVCGSAFGLEVQRHRLFMSNEPLMATVCIHETFPPDPITGKPRPWGIYHVPGDSIPSGGRTALDAAHAAELMGVRRSLPWGSIKEGFPPRYTEWIGTQLLASLGVEPDPATAPGFGASVEP